MNPRPHSRTTGVSILGMLLAIPMLLLILLFLAIGFYEARKAYWDYQVRELCAKDGGIRVYETITLPPTEYERFAKRNWIFPNKKEANPTDTYYYVVDIHYYRDWNPQVSRQQYFVVRNSDGKVLGASTRYGRGGGDIPGPWHPSSFTCPKISKDIPSIESSIFAMGGAK